MSAAAIIEELLEYFEDRADASMEPGEDRFHGNKEMALLQEVQKLSGYISEAPRWVSVEERVPESESPAWVATNAKRLLVAAFGDGQWWVWQGKGRKVTDYLENVTHWMPLPEAPK